MQLSHAFRLYLPRSRMTHWKQQHTIDVSRAHSLIIMNNHQPEWSRAVGTLSSLSSTQICPWVSTPHTAPILHTALIGAAHRTNSVLPRKRGNARGASEVGSATTCMRRVTTPSRARAPARAPALGNDMALSYSPSWQPSYHLPLAVFAQA
jgi:hypothetical protein